MPRHANGGGFSFAMVSDSESEIVLKITGKGAIGLFANEAGGHRWQRVPPTEQNGRRHSSTFTVAVLSGSDAKAEFDKSEIEFEATIGHGPGSTSEQDSNGDPRDA